MTSNTKLKLKEALFFLQKMETHLDIDPDFDFYLNAFVSSSRSVKWIMNKEYSNVEGWEEWNKNISSVNEKVNCLRKISKLRNLSLKEKPLITSKEYIFPIPEGIKVIPSVVYKILVVREESLSDLHDKEIEKAIEHEFGSNAITFTAKREIMRIIEKSDEDVLLLSQYYYQWLENLVNECENQFKFN